MKLLAATTRYYLLLIAALFAVAAGLLYGGLTWALRVEVEEGLRARELAVRQLAAGGQPLPAADPSLQRSRRPRPLGLRDTLRRELGETELVPHRQLTFYLPGTGPGGRPPEWITLTTSLVETDDVLGVVLGALLVTLGLLLPSVVGLNRWLTGRLWAPFQHTLAALRAYHLGHDQPLHLPVPAIAEFAELNQALNHLSERLVADYQSLRAFTANAAHETQTPLAIMQAELEHLLQIPALAEDEVALGRVSELLRATRRLTRLLQALRLLSQLENRQFAPAQAVPVRLDQVLAERAAALAPLLEARDLHLTLNLPSAPLQRQLHPGLADSLLYNLLYNAVKHNHPGGQLQVDLHADYLRVRNTGPVIEGDPARFFERFRKHEAASDSPGLGLSLVQHICAYYGFTVSYTFEPAGAWHTLLVRFA
jgi:signal transduction histidine kinase